MAGFRSVKKYAQAWEDGRVFTSHFRKAYGTSAAGWSDLSMQAGGPPANYYASTPLEAATLNGNRGFYIGDNKSPANRYLTHFGYTASSINNVGAMILCDYLLYYPFIDCDDLTTQTLINDVALPRYTSGEGVMVVPVSLTAHTPPGGNFTFEYVNQAGVTKTSQVTSLSLFGGPVSAGTILTSLNNVGPNGPFCLLASGDSGVRQINSVTFGAVNGGLMALVLVKVLLSVGVREASTMTEVEMVTNRCGPPQVYDGAYLNLMQHATTSLSGSVASGYINFIWDEGT